MLLRNLSLRRQLSAALITLSTVVILAGVISGIVYIQLDKTNTELTQGIFKSQASSRDVYEAAINQEAGVRGYLLVADPQYLEPYNTGAAQLTRTIPNLRAQVPIPAIDQRVKETLEALTVWDRNFAQPTIELRRQGIEVTDQQVALGKALFDDFRAKYAKLFDTLLDRRQHLIARQHAQLEELGGLLAAAVITLLLVSLVVWVVLNRRVVQPVARLLDDVQRVAGGEIEHIVKVDGPADVVELSDGVEAMRNRIVGDLRTVELARAELARSNSDLEQFAYVASHDLQEPLRKITSFCQLLEQRYSEQLDDRGKQYIDFAVSGAKRMQRLINDLLAFSRVGSTKAKFKDVDLTSAVGDAIDNLGELISETNATVRVGDLPNVDGEGSLLSALFQNLISNGIKFRPPNTEPIIDISIKDAGEMWQLSVKDNGIGIDPEYAERIFVIFQRLHGREEYGGTGIGLAVCRKIVEFHSGKIWLDNNPSEGATFHFTLPKQASR